MLFFVLFINANTMDAQKLTNTLSQQERCLVTISALTATGDLENLKTQLNTGLEAGLTINEIKEALTQLYAYCGFPRSLNAINAFRAILDERKARGITDSFGKAIVIENNVADKYEQGRKVLEVLTKTSQVKPAPGFGEFAPRIDAFLKEHLFADIFVCDVLTYQQRELVTIAALAAMTGVEPQLQAHIGMGMNTGVSVEQANGIFNIIEKSVGRCQAEAARAVLLKMIQL